MRHDVARCGPALPGALTPSSPATRDTTQYCPHALHVRTQRVLGSEVSDAPSRLQAGEVLADILRQHLRGARGARHREGGRRQRCGCVRVRGVI